MDVDLSDLNRHIAELGKVGPRVAKKAAFLVEAATRGTERDGKILAAVDTGTMRDSITSEVRGLTGEVGPTAEYAIYVELGTSRMAPQPFMGPATDRNAALFFKGMETLADREGQ
ncbi:HK97-gp10 family putative phage morphogenesis protein [Phycicoccus avicenniae]|uniref:HK97-gp10 family putative phage morphogenesis protein n=1 Tax=Phycicoccus avicenniae TaxID=2828860 RepID=UPI003D26A922